MKQFLLICALFLTASTSSAQDQQKYILKAGAQQNIAPVFKLNDDTFRQAASKGIRLSLYNFETVPVAVEFYGARGYDSSVDYAYGTNLSYIFFSNAPHWLKAGVSGGRIKMGTYQRGEAVGSVREDEFHEMVKPFVEWNWNFSPYLSLFVQSGYRFLRSETETVTGIVDRYENGDPKTLRVTADQKLYGSGFEFGIGLDIKLHQLR